MYAESLNYYFIFTDSQEPLLISNKVILKQLLSRAYEKGQVVNVEDNCNMNLEVVSAEPSKVIFKVLLGTVTV